MYYYYCYSVKYGQYFAPPFLLGDKYIKGDYLYVDDICDYLTEAVTRKKYIPCALPLESWKKSFDEYHLDLEKISPIEDTRIIPDVYGKKPFITRAILIDSEDDCMMLHFEKMFAGTQKKIM